MFHERMQRREIMRVIAVAIVFILLSLSAPVYSAPSKQPEVKHEKITQEQATPVPAKILPAPVVFEGKTLFYVQAKVLSFAPEERAKLIRERIVKLARNPVVQIENIKAIDDDVVSQVAAGDFIVMSVTDADATAGGMSRSELAKEYARIIKAAVTEQRSVHSMKAILLGVFFAILLTLLFFLAAVLIKKLFVKLRSLIESWKGVRIPSLRFQKLEIITSAQITDFLLLVTRLLRIFVSLFIFYLYVVLVLQLFPWTKNLSSRIVGYIVKPLSMFGHAFASYLPDLFVIVVIILLTYYGLKLIKIVFTAIEKGMISFSGFYPEWAQPTFAIVKILIISFSVVVAFPYLPGSDSPAFRGVSLFIGLLLSLGSTSAVANMVAGVIITYMRAFKIGDRVRIADATGDVLEKSLLVTRVRTIKNEDITIPNASVLNSHIINYSSSILPGMPLILHTGVTIGYDAPWRKVHELLLAAAAATERVLKNPAPFVLQTGLDDFYVRYELNAYTGEPAKMALIYSELHQHIQDKFNEAGVEIMSPHYGSLRDGNRTTIPEDHLPGNYTPPPFRMEQVKEEPHEKI